MLPDEAAGSPSDEVLPSGQETAAASDAPLSVDGAMLSDPGQVRRHNEDCAAYLLARSGARPGGPQAVALIADGMGGHAAGEIASRIACEVALRELTSAADAPTQRLQRAIEAANAAVLAEAAAKPELTGMGTTLTALLVEHGQAFLGHVGDSRLYILRDGTLHQLSEDHSLVARMVREGLLTEAAARIHPERNVIYMAVGTSRTVAPSVWKHGLLLLENDVLMLCSDGLSDVLPPERIIAELDREGPLEACQALLDAALAAGAPDNVTVGVFRLVRAAPSLRPAGTTRARSAGPMP